MTQQFKYWTPFSGLPRLLSPLGKYALIINGGQMQESMNIISGHRYFSMISIIKIIEEDLGYKFTELEWHQSTKDGKLNPFHHAISLPENGGITPVINKLVSVNGPVVRHLNHSDTTTVPGTPVDILLDKLTNQSMLLSLQENLGSCDEVLFITDSSDDLSLLMYYPSINLNKLKICIPRKDPQDRSIDRYINYILKDASGTPIYIEDILSRLNLSLIGRISSPSVPITSNSSLFVTPDPLKSYADILISQPTVRNHYEPDKSTTPSTVGRPKCMYGRECKFNNRTHNAEYRHPCRYYARCKFLTDSDHGTAQERNKHFTVYGHPCLFSASCRRPKHQPHWMTHEHLIDYSRILSQCSNSDCPSLQGNDHESIQHREHFSHPCKYGKDCPSNQDIIWNHDHRFYYRH